MTSQPESQLQVQSMPRALGSLESRLMEALWGSTAELSVQEVCDALDAQDNYKTVMTVLNRLVEKGLLERRLDGRAYQYHPHVSRQQFLQSAAHDTVQGFADAYGDEGVIHLIRAVAMHLSRHRRSRLAPIVAPIVTMIVAASVVRALLTYLRGQKKRS